MFNLAIAMTKMKMKLLPGVCLLFWTVSAAFAAGEPDAARSDSPFAFSLHPKDGLLAISHKGRRLLVYTFATNQFKPYVREFYTLQGDNLLVDSPPDHAHHHGLMYGIRVNGVNFWEETGQPGYEIPAGLPEVKKGVSTGGAPLISFAQTLHWVPSADRAAADITNVALLIERRTLALTVDEARDEVALHWNSQFEAGRVVPKVLLSGANYHGLGLRLPEAFNKVARHRNSEGAAYPSGGTGDVTPARWSAVSHVVEGREITAALFGRPEPGRGMARFFTMVQPFTYLSVTQGLDTAPIEYQAGEKFELAYLLTVYPRRVTPQALEKRYQDWKPL